MYVSPRKISIVSAHNSNLGDACYVSKMRWTPHKIPDYEIICFTLSRARVSGDLSLISQQEKSFTCKTTSNL